LSVDQARLRGEPTPAPDRPSTAAADVTEIPVAPKIGGARHLAGPLFFPLRNETAQTGDRTVGGFSQQNLLQE
jgi:hypothetical protein